VAEHGAPAVVIALHRVSICYVSRLFSQRRSASRSRAPRSRSRSAATCASRSAIARSTRARLPGPKTTSEKRSRRTRPGRGGHRRTASGYVGARDFRAARPASPRGWLARPHARSTGRPHRRGREGLHRLSQDRVHAPRPPTRVVDHLGRGRLVGHVCRLFGPPRRRTAHLGRASQPRQ